MGHLKIINFPFVPNGKLIILGVPKFRPSYCIYFQISVLTHQKNSAEDLIKQQRTRSQEQVQEMEKKLHDMQELVFTKMREANSARDLNIPLKAEIEAMKALLEEEEKR